MQEMRTTNRMTANKTERTFFGTKKKVKSEAYRFKKGWVCFDSPMEPIKKEN